MANKLEVQIEANVANLQRGLATAQQAVAAFRDQVSQQLNSASNATIPVRPVVDTGAVAAVKAEVEKAQSGAASGGKISSPIDNESLKNSEQDVRGFVDHVFGFFQQISNAKKISAADDDAWKRGVRELADGYAAVGRAVMAAAAEVGAIQRQLSAAGFKGEALTGAVEQMHALRRASSFSAEEIAHAQVAFKKFGDTSEESLKTAANLAAGTGHSLGETAQLLGLLGRGGEDTTRAVMMLSRGFNITGEQLKQFGADVDDSGKVLTNTKDRAERAKGALEQFVAVNYGDAAKSMQSATDEMNAHLEELEAHVGKSANEWKGSMIRGAIIPFIDYLDTQVPNSLKGFFGLLASGTGQILSFAASMAQVGVNVKLLRTAFPTGNNAGSGVEAQASDQVTAAQERQAAATEQTVGAKQRLVVAHEQVAGAAQTEVTATTEAAGAHEAATVAAGEHALAEESVVTAETGAVTGAEAETVANTELAASHQAAAAAALEHAGAEEAAAGAAASAGGASAGAGIGLMGALGAAGAAAGVGALVAVTALGVSHYMGWLKTAKELNEEWKQQEARMAAVRQKADVLAQARLDGWAGKTGEQLIHMGVTFQQASDAAKYFSYQITDVQNNDKMTAATKQRVIAHLREEQQGYTQAATSIKAYHEAAKQSLDEAHTATVKAQADIAGGFGSQAEVISRLRSEAEATDRDTEGDNTEAAKQKRIAAWQAYYAAVKQARDDDTKAQEDAMARSTDAANLEVEHRKQIVAEHKRDGSVQLQDDLAVIDAEVEAERRSYEAKRQALQNQLQAEASSGKARANEVAALNKALQNLDREHNNKLRGLRDERLADEEAEADRGLAIQRHRYDEYLTVVQDYQAELGRRREHGEDVSGQDHQAILSAYTDEVNKENAEFDRLIKNKKKGTQEYEDFVKSHNARLRHLHEKFIADEDAADKRAAAARAENINAEKDIAVAHQTRVNTQISKLEELRSKGQNVEAEMATAIQKEADLRDEIIKKTRDAALETERNDLKRQAINEKADADLESSQSKRDQDLKRNHEAELQRQEDVSSKRKAVLESEKNALDMRIKREMNAGRDVQGLYQQEYDLEVKIAQQEYQTAIAAAEKLGTEEKLLDTQKAALDLQNAQVAAADKLKESLDKAQDANKKKSKSPLMSVEDAFSGKTGGVNLGDFTLGQYDNKVPTPKSDAPPAPTPAPSPSPAPPAPTPTPSPSPAPPAPTQPFAAPSLGSGPTGAVERAHVVVSVNGEVVHELKVDPAAQSPLSASVADRQNVYYQPQTYT